MGEQPTDPAELYASALLHWPAQITNLEQKAAVAARAAAHVQDGQIVGIGSGSNTYLALWAIGERVKREDLRIQMVTSSYETGMAALRLGIPQVPLGSVEPDWGVDGADEVDPGGRLIKGRGGALFKEKILWATAHTMYLAVDKSKHVQRLGERFPIPIEVDRAAVDLVGRALAAAGSTAYEVRVAEGKDGPVVTESGNFIIDARFDEIPEGLAAQLKALSGVIETGLFEGYEFELL
jgi:ribose 5-phosphate isomerase A